MFSLRFFNILYLDSPVLICFHSIEASGLKFTLSVPQNKQSHTGLYQHKASRIILGRNVPLNRTITSTNFPNGSSKNCCWTASSERRWRRTRRPLVCAPRWRLRCSKKENQSPWQTHPPHKHSNTLSPVTSFIPTQLTEPRAHTRCVPVSSSRFFSLQTIYQQFKGFWRRKREYLKRAAFEIQASQTGLIRRERKEIIGSA